MNNEQILKIAEEIINGFKAGYMKAQADEKATVAETTSSSPKPEAVVPPVTEEKGERFTHSNVSGLIFDQYANKNTIQSYLGGVNVCDLLNSLHDSNEMLKRKLEQILKEKEDLKKELADSNDTVDQIGKQVYDLFIEILKQDKELEEALYKLKVECDRHEQTLKDLAQVKEEKEHLKKDQSVLEDDLLKMAKRVADLSRALNDKQLTATQTTPNTPKEKLWCAMCGSWGDHQSGTCPEVPRASNEKDEDEPPFESIDFNFRALFDRLDRVEKIIKYISPLQWDKK